MITLYTFGAAFGLPDLSPYVIKAHVLLKMAGLPYESNSKGFRRAPKGKLPYIEDKGQIVADSTFIRWHLERHHGADFDKGLSPEQRAQAWAVEKLLEDNLYWISAYWRWMNEANFKKLTDLFFKGVPKPLRWVIEPMVLRKMRKSFHAQGVGRLTDDERLAIARHGIETLSTLLGERPYLMGETPCSTDAMFFAAMASSLCTQFESPATALVKAHPNLVAYEARMRQRYFTA